VVRCLLAVLIAVVCGITLGNDAPALAQEPASRATAHAQIVAHGVVPIPAGNIGWRVLSRDSSPDDVAATAGFLLADRGVVLVTDQETRDLFRLAPGMALLTRDGHHQQRTSAEAGAARYYAIELVPASQLAEGSDADSGFTSDPFPGLDALHEIGLLRDVLADGELTEVPPGTAPTLVLATAGAIDVATAPGQTPVRLAAGQAVVMGGTLSIAANVGPATFVAAVIGPEVVLPSARTSDPGTATGTISVQGLTCPSDSAAKNACEYTDEIFAGGIVLGGPDGIELTFGNGESHAVSHVWQDIPFGTYYFSRIDLAEPAGHRLERIDGTTVVDSGVEAIVVDATHPQVSIDFIYVPINASSAPGTLTLSFHACPTATSPLAECASRFVEGEIAIEGPGGIRLDRGNSDVSQRGDRRWENLPLGTYNLVANLLQVEEPELSVARVDGAEEYVEGVATVELDVAHPDAVLDVVFAPGGPALAPAGAIQVTGLMCPADPSAGDCRTYGELGDVSIFGPEGGVLTLFNGTSHGASYVWEGLPYGVYTFDALAHTPPPDLLRSCPGPGCAHQRGLFDYARRGQSIRRRDPRLCRRGRSGRRGDEGSGG
jgi:hypothetical protein